MRAALHPHQFSAGFSDHAEIEFVGGPPGKTPCIDGTTEQADLGSRGRPAAGSLGRARSLASHPTTKRRSESMTKSAFSWLAWLSHKRDLNYRREQWSARRKLGFILLVCGAFWAAVGFVAWQKLLH
jgi:hypothetical protein